MWEGRGAMSKWSQQSPQTFVENLRVGGHRRTCVLWDVEAQRARAFGSAGAELAAYLTGECPDFDAHEAVFLEVGRESGALFGAFLHRTQRGQAQGGLRRWHYETLADFLRDGLRLARAMGRKNALAGLWWGGGKGLIARPLDERNTRDPEFRRLLYCEYGDFVSSLRGAYVTAEDAGTTPQDVACVFERTRFATCIPPEFGGSGNPSRATAVGVVCAMEAALDFLGLGSLSGKRVAMQGGGNVGAFMLECLLEKDVKGIVVSEISSERVQWLRSRFADARVSVRACAPGDNSILAENCDVLAPNALGEVIRPETIPILAARVVCGGANNPLADDERDGEALRARGICYVPDFVCNRMGIVSCANEQYGRVSNDPDSERQLGRDYENSIWNSVQRVLRRAEEESVTPFAAADRLAAELSREPHPIFGHRTRRIVAGLIADHWERG